MKKILLIGNLNKTLQNLSECLLGDFQVQLCSEQLETIQRMVKLQQPDLLLISQVGLVNEDVPIFEWIAGRLRPQTVLVVATAENENHLEILSESKHTVHVMKRPITKSELVTACQELLHIEPASHVPGEEQVILQEDKPKLLIVDDSPLVLRNMKNLLDQFYQISVATSGEQALQFIPKKKPDLVLLDYDMPGMDGKETFERMKQDEAMNDIPVVFLTGVAERSQIVSVLKYEPAGYILKPPVQDKLLEVIGEILSNR